MLTDPRTDPQMDPWTDGWTDGWMDGQTHPLIEMQELQTFFLSFIMGSLKK